jgi:Cytochrome b5-like Heme/Steroid binding domain
MRMRRLHWLVRDVNMAESVGGGHANGGDGSAISRFFGELVSSPLNLALLGVCTFLLYKILRARRYEPPKPKEPELPPMKKRDFTLSQLREFDGREADGRILIAVNGKVFDVTRGKRFYGPGMNSRWFIFCRLCRAIFALYDHAAASC